MEILKYIVENWEVIAGIIVFFTGGGFLGWKLKHANTQIARGDMIKSMQNAYDGWVQDDAERYNGLKKEVSALREEANLSRRVNLQQLEKINRMEETQQKSALAYEKLSLEYASLEKKYNSLKAAFEKLRRK
jgi:chlorite dismutase